MFKLVKPFYMLLLYPRSGNPANRYTSYLLYILPRPKFYHIWPIGSIHIYPFIANTNNIDENQTIWFWKRNIAEHSVSTTAGDALAPCVMMASSIGTFFVLLASCAGNSPVTGEFPSQRPVTRSFGVFFDLRLNNQQLSKQWRRRRFETPSCSSWRHCNGHYHGNGYVG